jgi:polyribonucleotide nucleotidyltransferase
MRNDVSVVATIMSMDPDCAPETVAMLGASIAVSISDIPWNGPIAGVTVGSVDGSFVINPGAADREKSALQLTVVSSAQKIVMIEAGADQLPDDDMFDAIMLAHSENQKLVSFIDSIKKEIGKPKFDYAHAAINQELYEEVKEYALDKVRFCLDTDDKNVRDERLGELRADITDKYSEKYPDLSANLETCLYKMQKYVVRRWLLDEGKRVDGRGMHEVRPLAAEVGLLPRTHGSGLFTRGQTQVLTVATLGTIAEVQKLDNIFDEETKRYMHHYNFPPYSVGEARSSRGPGRREIGHGASRSARCFR